MQEYQVTAGGQTYPLRAAVLRAGHAEPHRAGRDLSASRSAARPLHVHGEHRLSQPDARSGRSSGPRRWIWTPSSEAVLSAADILHVQKVLRKLPVSDHVVDYAVSLARATRPKQNKHAAPSSTTGSPGAPGPRAAQYLVLGAKANAILNGRLNVSCDDVRARRQTGAAAPHLHQLQCRRRGDRPGPGGGQAFGDGERKRRTGLRRLRERVSARHLTATCGLQNITDKPHDRRRFPHLNSRYTIVCQVSNRPVDPATRAIHNSLCAMRRRSAGMDL